VITVEHNLDFLAACDWLVELGPGGGHEGGKLVGAGRPRTLERVDGSPTGAYLRNRTNCA